MLMQQETDEHVQIETRKSVFWLADTIPLHPGDSLALPRLGSNVEWQAIRRKLMSLVRQATDVTG